MDRSRVRVALLIQARSNSSRLPGKIFAPLAGPGESTGRTPVLLERIAERLERAWPGALVRVLAPEGDQRLLWFCRERGLEVLTGPEEDVRERYRRAARELDADVIVRATGDNPCVDPEVARETIVALLQSDADLLSYGNLPLGIAVEAMTGDALLSDLIPANAAHREHVSLHIKHHPEVYQVEHPEHPVMQRFPGERPRLTVDTPADLEVVQNVFRELGSDFRTDAALELFHRQPELFAANRSVEQRVFTPGSLLQK